MNTVAKLAIEEFHTRNINFVPLYPAILIRVLPKEQVSSGGIIMPETKQNKPLYEGIVLRLYEPKRVKVDDKWVLVDAGVEVGDHIVFPHWSGEPVPWLSDENNIHGFDEYRLIPARGIVALGGKDTGEPLLIINYEKESPRQKLHELISEVYDEGYGDGREPGTEEKDFKERILKSIFQEFDILRKVKGSRTVSGD
jgi:co-chaperonin GroES (HSP10)